MAVLPIVKFGSSVLAEKARPVTTWDESLEALVGDMVETMHAASGIGLAANQVGLGMSLAVIDLDPRTEHSRLFVLCNPEIVETSGAVKDEEGCLSIPGLVAAVERPERTVVRYRDLRGGEQVVEGTGLMARALCHEIDHLSGLLFPQRIRGIRGDLVRNRMRKMHREDAWKDIYP